MGKNANLNAAKAAKNDEFYTRYEDIEKEVGHYWDQLKGKRVFCPCDDYRSSNFVRYFKENYDRIGLAGLTATNYDIGDGAWKYTFDGRNESVARLEGDGDFRSPEITAIKDGWADVVVTNPPFSLFREYVAQLMEYGKKFLIIGNKNAITYKEIFPYIKENKLWTGVRNFSGGMWFLINSEDDCKTTKIDDGQLIGNVATCWFTNIEHDKRHQPLDFYKHYSNEYQKYDNYDAIEVSKVVDIPMDYDGVMGVPITFLDKYCPDQFFLLGLGERPFVNGKGLYKRLLIQRRRHAIALPNIGHKADNGPISEKN